MRCDDETLPLENGVADFGDLFSAHRLRGVGSRLDGLAALLLSDLLEQLFDPVLMADGFVEGELQLGRATQSQPLADLPPHEPGGTFERPRGVFLRRRIAQARVEHARVLQIGADLHARHRHEPDTGIVQLARDHGRHFGANLIRNTFWSGSLAHKEAES